MLARRRGAAQSGQRIHRPAAISRSRESSPSFRANPIARPPIRNNKRAYRDGNVVERCFCRLKDFRRIATRYDKLARNFLSALCLVATLAYWL
jgi:transposase